MAAPPNEPARDRDAVLLDSLLAVAAVARDTERRGRRHHRRIPLWRRILRFGRQLWPTVG
ncbi:MAG TPA: hypothetical protein VFQ38_00680 [Longimicrobiales bacterium]|nr:hypothetical protein [Longimicrobiales bacterium]